MPLRIHFIIIQTHQVLPQVVAAHVPIYDVTSTDMDETRSNGSTLGLDEQECAPSSPASEVSEGSNDTEYQNETHAMELVDESYPPSPTTDYSDGCEHLHRVRLIVQHTESDPPSPTTDYSEPRNRCEHIHRVRLIVEHTDSAPSSPTNYGSEASDDNGEQHEGDFIQPYDNSAPSTPTADCSDLPNDYEEHNEAQNIQHIPDLELAALVARFPHLPWDFGDQPDGHSIQQIHNSNLPSRVDPSMEWTNVHNVPGGVSIPTHHQTTFTQHAPVRSGVNSYEFSQNNLQPFNYHGPTLKSTPSDRGERSLISFEQMHNAALVRNAADATLASAMEAAAHLERGISRGANDLFGNTIFLSGSGSYQEETRFTMNASTDGSHEYVSTPVASSSSQIHGLYGAPIQHDVQFNTSAPGYQPGQPELFTDEGLNNVTTRMGVNANSTSNIYAPTLHQHPAVHNFGTVNTAVSGYHPGFPERQMEATRDGRTDYYTDNIGMDGQVFESSLSSQDSEVGDGNTMRWSQGEVMVRIDDGVGMMSAADGIGGAISVPTESHFRGLMNAGETVERTGVRVSGDMPFDHSQHMLEDERATEGWVGDEDGDFDSGVWVYVGGNVDSRGSMARRGLQHNLSMGNGGGGDGNFDISASYIEQGVNNIRESTSNPSRSSLLGNFLPYQNSRNPDIVGQLNQGFQKTQLDLPFIWTMNYLATGRYGFEGETQVRGDADMLQHNYQSQPQELPADLTQHQHQYPYQLEQFNRMADPTSGFILQSLTTAQKEKRRSLLADSIPNEEFDESDSSDLESIYSSSSDMFEGKDITKNLHYFSPLAELDDRQFRNQQREANRFRYEFHQMLRPDSCSSPSMSLLNQNVPTPHLIEDDHLTEGVYTSEGLTGYIAERQRQLESQEAAPVLGCAPKPANYEDPQEVQEPTVAAARHYVNPSTHAAGAFVPALPNVPVMLDNSCGQKRKRSQDEDEEDVCEYCDEDGMDVDEDDDLGGGGYNKTRGPVKMKKLRM
ncbi:hypothetical protein HDU76_007255, partial [Blyttiomyces sp. JEL0837]